MTKLTGIAIYTQDVPRLAKFYGKVFDAQVEGDEVHAQLKDFGVAFYNPGGVEEAPVSNITSMFQVEDVDAEYRRLISLGLPIKFTLLPTTQPWGTRAMWFLDPDGNEIDFYQPNYQGK